MPTLNGAPLDFEALLRDYGPLVLRLTLQGTGGAADAEDVAQEVFVSLAQSRARFADESHLRAWLVRAAANRCKNWARSAWRRHTVPLADQERLPAGAEEDGAVLEAVAALPPKYRWCVHLHYVEGYTAGEIGKMLGCPKNTVLSRLMRARALLRQQLKEEWE